MCRLWLLSQVVEISEEAAEFPVSLVQAGVGEMDVDVEGVGGEGGEEGVSQEGLGETGVVGTVVRQPREGGGHAKEGLRKGKVKGQGGNEGEDCEEDQGTLFLSALNIQEMLDIGVVCLLVIGIASFLRHLTMQLFHYIRHSLCTCGYFQLMEKLRYI